MKAVHKNKRCIIWAFTVLLIMATVCLTAGCSSNGLVSWLFSAQYNENGVSHVGKWTSVKKIKTSKK